MADRGKMESLTLETPRPAVRGDLTAQKAKCLLRRRRLVITLFSFPLCWCLLLIAWVVWENEPLLDLPNIQNPIPADASSPPSLRRSATLYDANFSFYLNLETYSQLYPALQTYRCQAVIGLLGYCKTQEPLILLAVKSHAVAKERRHALRRTWAKERQLGGYHLKPIFLMANSGKKRQMERLVYEASQHGDILLWNFFESHHNLSLKERCFLEWLTHRCKEATYIFKGDDDEFMNPYALVSYISSSFPKHPSQIHGQLQIYSPPARWGKYDVPTSVYPNDFYPPFVSGGGFLLPYDVVPALHLVASTIPVFPLDDVFLGFLALAAKVTFHHEPRFHSFGVESDDNCHFQDGLVVHGITPLRILEVWSILPNVKPCPQNLSTKKKEEEKDS